MMVMKINKIARIVEASFEVSFTNMIEGLQRLEAKEVLKTASKKTRKRK